MNVYEEEKHPFLKKEDGFIEYRFTLDQTANRLYRNFFEKITAACPPERKHEAELH